MKKNELKTIGMLLLITIIVIMFIIVRNNNEENDSIQVKNQIVQENKEEHVQLLDDGTKVIKSTKLNERKTIDGLEIGNIQMTTTKGETTLLAEVKNNTKKDINIMAIDIILLDKEGKEIVKFPGVIGNLKVDETARIESSTTLDFSNAYDFKIVIK